MSGRARTERVVALTEAGVRELHHTLDDIRAGKFWRAQRISTADPITATLLSEGGMLKYDRAVVVVWDIYAGQRCLARLTWNDGRYYLRVLAVRVSSRVVPPKKARDSWVGPDRAPARLSNQTAARVEDVIRRSPLHRALIDKA